jgi:hypothetical protein
MNTSETQWRSEQAFRNWVMPRAAWWKRLRVIRHFRGAIALYHSERFARKWASIGIGSGTATQYDLWICYGISAGHERSNAK